jgi:hypothetical protein
MPEWNSWGKRQVQSRNVEKGHGNIADAGVNLIDLGRED